MTEAGQNVAVALSGGPDSVYLLCFLFENLNKLGIKLSALHLNHLYRKEGAERDEAFCRNLCKKLGLPLHVKRTDIKALAKEKGMSLEEAGRMARLEFFNEIKIDKNIHRIATGHNADDQAETVLMRILKGTSPRGLAGIRPVLSGYIIRPLLEVPKRDILDFLHKKNIPYCTDETNRDESLLRNRIRHSLIPLLKKEYNSEAVSALNRLVRTAQSQEAYLEEITAQRLKSAILEEQTGRIALDIDFLARQNPYISSLILRRAYFSLAGSHEELSYTQTEKLMELLNSATGAGLSLPAGWMARVSYHKLILSREKSKKINLPKITVPIPGRTVLKEWGLVLDARYKDNPTDEVSRDPFNVNLDADQVPPGLYFIRNRQNGDRFYPLNAPGEKKLKEILIDRKIPRERRDRIPLLTDGNRIIWVAGVSPCHICRIKPGAERVLSIRIEAVSNDEQDD